MNNFERRVLRIERTINTVHSSSTNRNTFFMLCSIDKWLLCYSKQFDIFYCERSELQICRVYQFSVSKTVDCRVLNFPGDKKS